MVAKASSFDVVSGGELFRVQQAGAETSKVIFAGVGKTDDEIRYALNADILRVNEEAQKFVRSMDDAGKVVAAICHAPWLLVSAGLVGGKTLTSYPTLRDDIDNAGGQWVDREVVTDGNWITSRKPDDVPAFNRETMSAIQHSLSAARANGS